MEFNVAQLLKEPVGATREYDVDDWPEPPQDVVWTSPVRGHARLTRMSDGILVRADLAGRIEVDCARCLEKAEAPVAMQIADEYFPTIDINTGYRLPDPEDDAAFRIDEHHILSLSEAVRQYGVVNQPISALCSETCAGLCPNCGSNLNQGACECPPAPATGPWAALKDLKLD